MCGRINEIITNRLAGFEGDFLRPYFTIFTVTVFNWLLSSLAVYFCVLSFSVNIGFDQVLLFTTLSFLAGFAVLFLPAGIGAREAVLVFLLAPYCGTVTALTIASVHRLITIVLDLSFGSYALRMRSLDVPA